jgi:hypothetical protein
MDLDKEIAETKAEIAELKEELKKTEDPAMKTALRNDLTALRNKENILLQQRQGSSVLGLAYWCNNAITPVHVPFAAYACIRCTPCHT